MVSFPNNALLQKKHGDGLFTLSVFVVFLICFLTFNDLSIPYFVSDAQSYTSYLISWIIYGDFDFSFYEEVPPLVQGRFWIVNYEDYPSFPKTTMGIAILELPAFLIGHLIAVLSAYEADGWSAPYHIAVGVNGLLFLGLGVWALVKTLRNWFTATTAYISVILVLFASNLFYYAVFANGMSHVYNFSLVALGTFFFLKWLSSSTKWQLFLASFIFGLLVLVRPVNAVFLLLPCVLLLQKIKSLSPNNWLTIGFSALIFITVIIPQLIFWNVMTGDFLFYTYGEEKLMWHNPHILEGLFSYRNGWLLYTPIMGFAVIGTLFLKRDLEVYRWTILVILAIYIYVVFSWWAWFYGASFGIRPMIDIYAYLAIGLAALIESLRKSRFGMKVAALFFGLFFITHNLNATWHYQAGRISGSDMTKASYWDLFMDFSSTSNGQLLGYYEKPDYDMLLIGREERAIRSTIIKQWEKAEADTVSNEIKYGQVFSIPFEDSSYDENLYYKVTLDISADYNSHAQAVVAFELKDGEEAIDYYALRVQREVGQKERETVQAFIPKPNFEVKDGSLLILPWIVKGKFKMIVHSIKIELIRKEFVSK